MIVQLCDKHDMVFEMSELDTLLTRFNLSKDNLKKPCCDNLFMALKTEIPSFDDAAPHFGFKLPEIVELRTDGSQERERRLKMLWKWKEKNGSDATYLAIVNIFIEMKNKQLAEGVLTFFCEKKIPLIIESHVNPLKARKYASWNSMSKSEKEKITNTLLVENQIIRNKYSLLVDGILASFEKRKIEVDRLKLSIITSLGVIADVLKYKYEKASTLAGVLLILHDSGTSWFNIELLKSIVEKLGSDEDKTNITSYEQKDLVPYLQRSIFEIPSNSFGPGSGTADQISLGLRLPNEVIPTGNHVAVICHNLSQLLGIPDGILVFIRYDEGSTILIFGVPEALMHTALLQSTMEEYCTPDISKRNYAFRGDLTEVL